MSKRIWHPSAILDGKKYFLQLCQDENRIRYFDLTEHLEGENFAINPESFHLTEIIDNDLLKRRSMNTISERHKLTNGQPFFVDAHNVWLTESELKQLYTRTPHSEIIWSTPNPPKFPPA